jgi:hypothetical protein
MIIFLFIFTLLGVQIFGSKVSIIPNGKMETSWKTFTDSFLNTFQIMTLYFLNNCRENWNVLINDALNSDSN